MPTIRNSAKAVLLDGAKILVTENRDREGIFYLLPGGGQESGETLTEALVRECREETGLAVEVGSLLFVREYIASHHEFAKSEPDVHQVEFLFSCQAAPRQDLRNGVSPDHWQTGVEWLPLCSLLKARFYPAALKEPLLRWAKGDWQSPSYLGDVN
jgi:8-oxo-dGTP pyrophosphatase MutT (NUDIX family)